MAHANHAKKMWSEAIPRGLRFILVIKSVGTRDPNRKGIKEEIELTGPDHSAYREERVYRRLTRVAQPVPEPMSEMPYESAGAPAAFSYSDYPVAEERDELFDLLCVGFGPANIALAIALEEMWPSANVKFLEKAEGPCWQPAMLLNGADIQNNPVRDLVTPRNPRSRYTFINYLHENGRLFRHLNLPGHYPLRKEYARYIKWVAEQVPADVEYCQEVTGIRLARAAGGRKIIAVETALGEIFYAQSVVVAPGRSANIPPVFSAVGAPHVSHTSAYLHAIADLGGDYSGTLAVVGSSQSSIEVVLDLAKRLPNASIVNVMTGFGYRLKDTSPFSEEVYFPEFVDYYFNASPAGKDRLRSQLRPTNYSAADRDVIDALYSLIYEDELDGRARVRLCTNRVIDSVQLAGQKVMLTTTEHITGERDSLTVDRVILATGYRDLGLHERQEQLPPLLADLAEILRMDEHTGLSVARDYRVMAESGAADLPPVYINGLCETTHGLGDAGSFSLLALRAQAIVHSLRRSFAVTDGSDSCGHPEAALTTVGPATGSGD